MSSRKSELLDGALKYLVKHGVAHASLRPMASALGTSPRILMFHFRTKEGLLQEVFSELQSRLQASLRKMPSAASDRRVPPLKGFWRWAINEENLPYFRLLYEVQIIALQNPREYGRYLKKASNDWQSIALDLMTESLKSKVMVTLCIAVFDGLMIELMSSGDARRSTAALDLFISVVAGTVVPGRSTRPNRKR